MKNPPFYLLVMCLGLLLAAASCKKKEDFASGVDLDDRTALNALFTPLRTTPQKFIVKAGTNQAIYCNGGTKLTFYPGSFCDAAGKVIHGDVTVEVIEMYKPGAMIANRATTLAGGQILASGGQVYISATINGEKVTAGKYGIRFREDRASNKGMALFYGDTNNADSLVTWTIGPGGTGTTASSTDSIADSTTVVIIGNTGIDSITVVHDAANFYIFDSCVHFGWVNCDYFYGASAKPASVSVTVPEGFNQANCEVFVVLPGINAVSRLGKFTAMEHRFSLYNGEYLPSGLNMYVVLVAKKDGNYYYYEQKGLTAADNTEATATPAACTANYIKNKLTNL